MTNVRLCEFALLTFVHQTKYELRKSWVDGGWLVVVWFVD